uniref:lysine histidine transporter-like 8 n=1 Tax=Fragaria vesca subsp. vesca TaxID=101020 RepID=UPI0005C9E4B3|nr:PREDICTED: lysine histidine transporter-like 8 [Fragaria vesca subsp. vesca]XP_011458072.1 PREDICTED: lysine histidine transporter-like 8 [Fragaria vesca subsp. vesca]
MRDQEDVETNSRQGFAQDFSNMDNGVPQPVTMSPKNWAGGELNPQDAWLPLTESRKGTIYSTTFHLLCSGLGIQALLLPVAFATLGWAWGIICLSIVCSWKFYTMSLLVRLHESDSGIRYSRYVHLAVTAFGPKLGMLLALFPAMYLSGGACVQLIIIGGGIIKLLVRTVCKDGATCDPNSMHGILCFFVFMFMAICVAEYFPNLNSVAGVSVIGTITAIVYCTMIWALSIGKGRLNDVSYEPPAMDSTMESFSSVLNSVGIIFLAFRGQNVILEIQGTLPSNPRHPSCKRAWSGVTISHVVIALCLFSLALGGYRAYGNKVPFANTEVVKAVSQFHAQKISQFVLELLCILVLINCLTTFQIYGMVVFDNFEMKYTIRKKQPCPRWLRIVLRLFVGGFAFFLAVALPFLGRLSPLLGAVTSVPLTYVYPCFMWNSIKKPKPKGVIWCTNMGLGCLGVVLSVLFVVAAAWDLADKGLVANFFKP